MITKVKGVLKDNRIINQHLNRHPAFFFSNSKCVICKNMESYYIFLCCNITYFATTEIEKKERKISICEHYNNICSPDLVLFNFRSSTHFVLIPSCNDTEQFTIWTLTPLHMHDWPTRPHRRCITTLLPKWKLDGAADVQTDSNKLLRYILFI